MSSGSSSLSQSPSKCGRPAEAKIYFRRWNKSAAGCAGSDGHPHAEFISLKVPLFHQAGCGERPRNDAADIDAATSRWQRLRAVVATRR